MCTLVSVKTGSNYGKSLSPTRAMNFLPSGCFCCSFMLFGLVPKRVVFLLTTTSPTQTEINRTLTATLTTV